MLSLCGERLTTKFLDYYLHHDLIMLQLLIYDAFVQLRILEDVNYHQNFITSSMYHPGPIHKISCKSVYHFLSNVIHTDRLLNATTNITSFCQGGRNNTYEHVFLTEPSQSGFSGAKLKRC